MTRDTVRPLVKHLNEITQGTFFDYLVTPDGPLFAAIRKREARNSASNGFIPAKKLRFMLSDVPMEDVEKAANAAAAAQTQEEVTAILQHDFAYTLENIYKLPVFSVSKTLESFAPAIAALAYDHRILSSDDQSDVSNDLHRTTELLLQLIGIYFKKKVNASLDRLVISSQGLPSVDEMIDRRRAIKQIAPMIFIIETAHGNDYFVSTDDFALKVCFPVYPF
uniref:Uncharacterized protein n=1 Tax=Panagrolaimus superbus TaxID=310955 RepID=A0A914Z516_9BILA